MDFIYKTSLLLVFLFYSSTCQNIDYHNVEYRSSLKKLDPFMDDFVPTEYTIGLLSKYDKNVVLNGKVKQFCTLLKFFSLTQIV